MEWITEVCFTLGYVRSEGNLRLGDSVFLIATHDRVWPRVLLKGALKPNREARTALPVSSQCHLRLLLEAQLGLLEITTDLAKASIRSS